MFTMKTSVSALLLISAFACIGSSRATLPVIHVSENESSSQNERVPAQDVRKQNIYTRHTHNKEHSHAEPPKKKDISDEQQTTTAVE